MDVAKDVGPADKEAVFEVRLLRCHTQLQTWFMDDRGQELCGAFYVEVERLSSRLLHRDGPVTTVFGHPKAAHLRGMSIVADAASLVSPRGVCLPPSNNVDSNTSTRGSAPCRHISDERT